MSSYPRFEDFYLAVHGFEPYAWQCALADYARINGVLPDRVEVPTGMGKTSTIDIAVWALGLQLHKDSIRTMGQRIVHMVERQIVVEGAYSHVQELAQQLAKSNSTEIEPVAKALRKLDAEVPLRVTSFHGSKKDPRTWLEFNGAQVIVTTATQATLRLLGHGPGVARRVSSIHAGLLGMDAVLLFDEPHLATAQVHTIEEIIAVQKSAEQGIGGVPATSLTLLGATVPPHLNSTEVTRVTFDVDAETNRAKQLWHAPKPVRLVQTEELSGAKLVDATLKHINVTIETALSGAPKIAVMVNSIASARKSYEQIQKLLKKLKRSDVSLKLVTSRTRAFDRSDAEALFGDTAFPQIVVSTQTLEVGADFSVDVLITELAPWPVLAQRLGRLNRHGESVAPEATIVIPVDNKGNLGTAASQHIYGEKQLNITGFGLLEQEVENASISIQSEIGAKLGNTAHLWPSPPRRPGMSMDIAVLLLASSTSPGTKADLTPWLQGPDTLFPVEPVTVLWRHWPELVNSAPPFPAEQVEVSIAEAKSLVAGVDLTAYSNDADMAEDTEIGSKKWEESRLEKTWIQKGNSWAQLTSLNEITPGSLLVLASDLGGYTPEFGVKPESKDVVSDISFEISKENNFGVWTVVPLLRTGVDSKTFPGAVEWETLQTSENLDNFADVVTDEDMSAYETKTYISKHIKKVLQLEVDVLVQVEGHSILIRRKFNQGSNHKDRVLLLDHSRLSAEIAKTNVNTAQASAEFVQAAATSGFLHDHAKAKQGFQIKLGNTSNDEAQYVAKELDGKRRSNLVCGLPLEYDHAMEAAIAAEKVGKDTLVCHLIGAHHGGMRGIHRGWQHTARWVDRYIDLSHKYGPWGLAWLEASVRLADWEASREPHMGSAEMSDWKELDRSVLDTILSDQPKAEIQPNTPQIALTGLSGPTLTLDWFASVGVLALARTQDLETTIRWDNNVPTLNTFADVQGLVDGFGKHWKAILAELSEKVVAAHEYEPGYTPKQVAEGKHPQVKLDTKNQRLPLTHKAIEWLGNTEWSDDTRPIAKTLWQSQFGRLNPNELLVDPKNPETIVSYGIYELPIPLLARNSTVFKWPVEFDPATVWDIGAGRSDLSANRGAGGLDLPQAATDEIAQETNSRAALVPLALFGSLSLGVGLEPGGRGTVSEYRRTRKDAGSGSIKRHSLELPIPDQPVTLSALSHLTHHGAELRDGRKIHAQYMMRGDEKVMSAVESQVVEIQET